MRPTKLAHLVWKEHINTLSKKELCLVDATCGNGHDSLFLSSFDNCTLHCIDIQEKAISSTKDKIKTDNVFYHTRNHNDLSFIPEEIDLIVYNLGYLPGSDKQTITTAENTIASLKSALLQLSKGGMISIMMYTGHTGGMEERNSILSFVEKELQGMHASHTTYPTKKNCPEILTLTSG